MTAPARSRPPSPSGLPEAPEEVAASGLRRRLGVFRPAAAATAGGRFAWAVTAANLWIISGLFLDGWFHIHRPGGETFFTPWHGILYSGVGAAIAVHLWQSARAGGSAPGYAPSAVGGLVVLFAGVADGAWHTALGIEADLAALLSPPHLLLITAGTLVFAGPLRAALRAPAGAGLPTALSAAVVVAGLGFFTQYVNPFTHAFTNPVGDPDLAELRAVAGVAGLIVWSVLVGGALATVHARTARVRGSLAVVVALPTLLVLTQQNHYAFVPAVLLAALAVELLGARLATLPLVAAATGLLATGWALTLLATEPVGWGAELLTGGIGSALAAGALVAWLVAGGRPAAVAASSGVVAEPPRSA